MKILAFVNVYEPGFRGGGPGQSLKNIQEALAAEISFSIITADRDKGDVFSYQGIETDHWSKRESGFVFYSSSMTPFTVWKILQSIDFEVLYLNSFFQPKFSLLPLIVALADPKVESGKILIAPRGEFSPGALGIKPVKKALFINLFKILRLSSRVQFHATSQDEKLDIEKALGPKARIHVAGNLPRKLKTVVRGEIYRSPVLKSIFLSRISPKKNLSYALNVLALVKHPLEFRIYGPIGDMAYWSQCQKLLADMPENVNVEYCGEVSPSDVQAVFAEHHLFFFPTLGENFGHVIVEALSAGCPVLLSDTTPWQDLESFNAGWVIPLSDSEKFVEVIDRLSQEDSEMRVERAEAAARYVETKLDLKQIARDNLTMFKAVASHGKAS